MGSRSTKTALGTCFPAPVSLKKVLKESSPPPTHLSEGIWPSGWIPCSKQYSSQHALPIWTPACPTWIEIHSRYINQYKDTILKSVFLPTYQINAPPLPLPPKLDNPHPPPDKQHNEKKDGGSPSEVTQLSDLFLTQVNELYHDNLSPRDLYPQFSQPHPQTL